MKHFTYETRRRFCPSCDGDGKGRIFPSADCWRCRGDGHLSEEPEAGERHIVLVHDESGQVVDIRVEPGTLPDTTRISTINFVVLVAALAILTILAFHH